MSIATLFGITIIAPDDEGEEGSLNSSAGRTQKSGFPCTGNGPATWARDGWVYRVCRALGGAEVRSEPLELAKPRLVFCVATSLPLL